MLRFLCFFIYVSSVILFQSAFAQDNYQKIYPIRTKNGVLPAPGIQKDCKYRFSWRLSRNDGSVEKITFDSGKLINENKFLIKSEAALLTELNSRDLELIRPLLNFGTQIDKILNSNTGQAYPLFYLLWESGDTNSSRTGYMSLMISFIYNNGSSNNFINLNPEDSMAIEAACPNFVPAEPTSISNPDQLKPVITPRPQPVFDITKLIPPAPVLISNKKGLLSANFRVPEVPSGIESYHYSLKFQKPKGDLRYTQLELYSDSKIITNLKRGRYKLKYRILTKDQKYSQWSQFSYITKVK